MSTAQKVMRGALWSYGAQLLTVFVQVAYAAVTSRIVDSAGFGAYSVALTATGLFTLISSGGLAQTVGRLRDGDEHELGAICTYAALMGGAFAVLTFLASGAVSEMWGVPQAAPIMRVLAINAFIAPVFGVAAGLMRRSGQFRQLASATVLCNVTGMGVGVACVLRFETAESLVVSAVTAQLLLTAVVIWFSRSMIRFGPLTRGNDAIGFSGKVIGSLLVQYAIGNAPRFAAANVLGAPALGQWNRAEVLATLPFQQLQAAVVPVVYPEFRHDRDQADRSYAVWAEMLALLAWITVPLGVLGSVMLPKIIPAVFGSHWGEAGLYAIPLALAGGIQPVVVLLASAIEAIGQFRIIWVANAAMLTTQLALSALVIWFESLWPAVLGLLVMNVLSHILYGAWAAKGSYLDVRRLLREYLYVAVASVALAIPAALMLYGLPGSHVGQLGQALGAVWLLVLLIAGVRWWTHLPPIRIAARRGLLKGGSVS